MSIVIDTPEGINMWVLLSRRSQLKLQMKGIKVPGIVKWCKANIEGCENARTARDCVVPVENAIAFAGGPQDFSIVNVHVMVKIDENLFADAGIYSDMSEVEANPLFVEKYQAGELEIVYTLDAPRPQTKNLYMP